jgi:GT2 family glycosyltransferase
VCWLNSDDEWLAGGLAKLVAALEADARAPMAYGRVWNLDEAGGTRRRNVEVRPFSEWLMARFNLVSQPATLIRRAAWEAVGGLDGALHMAMDYDLWWRLYRHAGAAPRFVDDVIAVNRIHAGTKTNTRRREHYEEAIAVVRKHYGRVPLKWWLAWPYAVWWRSR